MIPQSEPTGLEPFFLEGSAGRLFCLYHGPSNGAVPTTGILLAPPFAEEMNKVRRQVALQARAFAAQGFGVLIMDLYGTGDSEGEFGAARWDIWRDDLLRGAAWLEQRGTTSLVLWGIRFGSLLVADVLASLPRSAVHLLLWQPVVAGRGHMHQFFRLRVAADIISGGKPGPTGGVAHELEQGASVEVAGYELHPELVSEISLRDIGEIDAGLLPGVSWLETVAAQDRPMSLVSRRVIESWQAAGVAVAAETAPGEPYWTTPEITVLPGLIERSCRCIADAAP